MLLGTTTEHVVIAVSSFTSVVVQSCPWVHEERGKGRWVGTTRRILAQENRRDRGQLVFFGRGLLMPVMRLLDLHSQLRLLANLRKRYLMNLNDMVSWAHRWTPWLSKTVQGMVGRRESGGHSRSICDGGNVFRAALGKSGAMIRKRCFHQLLQPHFSGWPLRPLRFRFRLSQKSKFRRLLSAAYRGGASACLAFWNRGGFRYTGLPRH